MPSTISPAVSRASASAVPTMPGSRAVIAGIALNRWVTPVSPSSIARLMTSALASLCPAETRTPAAVRLFDKSRRHAFRRQRHQPMPFAIEPAQPLAILVIRRGDQVGPVDAGTLRAEKRPFQMQAEHAVRAGGLRAASIARLHLVARVGDQGRQARRRAVPAVRAGNGAHRIGGRLSLSSTPPPPLTCRSMKPGARIEPAGSFCDRHVAGNIRRRRNAHDAAVLDQNRGIGRASRGRRTRGRP